MDGDSLVDAGLTDRIADIPVPPDASSGNRKMCGSRAIIGVTPGRRRFPPGRLRSLALNEPTSRGAGVTRPEGERMINVPANSGRRGVWEERESHEEAI